KVGALSAPGHHVELGGPEDPFRQPGLAGDLAGHLFGGPVAGRGIEHPAAVVHQRLQHGADAVGVALARDPRERGRAPQAHHRQPLAGAGDQAGDELARAVVGQQQLRVDRQGHARQGGKLQVFTSGDHGSASLSRSEPVLPQAGQAPSPLITTMNSPRPSSTQNSWRMPAGTYTLWPLSRVRVSPSKRPCSGPAMTMNSESNSLAWSAGSRLTCIPGSSPYQAVRRPSP